MAAGWSSATTGRAWCPCWISPSGSGWPWCRWSTGSPPRPRTLDPSKTATRAWPGPRRTPMSSASTRRASSWPAAAPAAALLARDRGGPALAGQLLMCPMLDDRNDTPSSRQMAGLGIWDHAANEVGWTALLGPARGGADVSPYAAPARASDLSGLPPAFIDMGSAETFRDEDVAYATRIWQAGGSAELHVWPGGFHGFAGLMPG